MFWISDREGFSLIEALIAILIISIAMLIATVPTGTINRALAFIRDYFSPERPSDSYVRAMQLIRSAAELLMRKGYGTAIPDLSYLNTPDVQIEALPDVEKYYYLGKDVLEVITIVATYTKIDGSKGTIVEKFVRGNY